jgi:hypothetical protein
LNIEYPTRNLEVGRIFVVKYFDLSASGGCGVRRLNAALKKDTTSIKYRFQPIDTGR